MKRMIMAAAMLLTISAGSLIAQQETTDRPKKANDVKTDERIFEAPEQPKYKQHYPIPNLIITRNYESPRKLAEIARKEKDVPFILLPVNDTAESEILFFPSNSGYITKIERENLSKFIAFLRPKNTIFLGDETFVPNAYRLAVPEKFKTTDISDKNWKINSLILGNRIGLTAMPKLYQKYLDEKVAQEKLDAKIAEENIKQAELSSSAAK